MASVAERPDLLEMVENQRFFGTWFPSVQPLSGYGWPAWSNKKGEPVQLDRYPAMDGHGGWFVIRTQSTDEDGWLYGTKFERLSQPRPGGRAARRGGDTVRSRVWRRLITDRELQPLQSAHRALGHTLDLEPDFTEDTHLVVPPALPAAQGSQISGSQILSALTSNYIHKQLPKPSVLHIWQALMELWNDTVTRNKLNKMIPMDPYGLYLTTKAHRASAQARRRASLKTSEQLIVGTCPAPSARVSSSAGATPGSDLGLAGLLSNRSFNSWAAVTPASADLITKGPMAAFERVGGLPPTTVAGGGIDADSRRKTAASLRPGRTSPTEAIPIVGTPGGHPHAKVQVVGHSPMHGRYARRPTLAPPTTHRHATSHSLAQQGSHTAGEIADRDSHANSTEAPSSPILPSQSQHPQPDTILPAPSRSWRWPWQQPSQQPPSASSPPPQSHPLQSTSTFPDLHAGSSSRSHPPPPAAPRSTPAAQAPSSTCAGGPGTMRTPSTIQPLRGRMSQEDPVPPPSLLPDLSNPTALVEELLTIVNYTRAAYGYVMAAGHMANLGTFINLVGMSAWFNPITGASTEANNEAIHTLTGIPQSDILMAEWRNHVFRPCHYLAVDRAHGRLVLAIRGSVELGDICTDLAAQPVPVNFGGDLGQCLVHKGVISAAQYVEASTKEALDRAAKQYAGWPLLITGHSLGAGVASLLSIMMRFGYGSAPRPSEWADRVFSVAVACPPMVTEQVAKCCEEFIISLAHNMDFVTRLSHYSVEMAVMEIARGSPLLSIADNLSNVMNKMKVTLPWAGDGEARDGADGPEDSTGGVAAGLGQWMTGGLGSPQRSIDPELASQLLQSPTASTVEVELTRQQSQQQRDAASPSLQHTSTVPGGASGAGALQGADQQGPILEDAGEVLQHPLQQDAFTERSSVDSTLAARWFGPGQGPPQAPQYALWQGSFFGGWPSMAQPSSASRQQQAPSLPSAAPTLSRPPAEAGGSDSLIESPVPTDKLLDCWSDLVDVVKAEAQAAVDSISTSLDASLGGTLGAVSATGRKLPADVIVSRSMVRQAARPVADAADWVVVSPTTSGRPPVQGGGDLAGPSAGAADTAEPVTSDPLGSDLAAARSEAASGPSTLPDVMRQVVDDLQAAAADKQAHSAEVGVAPGDSEPLNREDVAKRLAPTKLYLPGRVLWVFLEDAAVVWDALNSQDQDSGEESGQQQGPGGTCAGRDAQGGQAGACRGPAATSVDGPGHAQPKAQAVEGAELRELSLKQVLGPGLRDAKPGVGSEGEVETKLQKSVSHDITSHPVQVLNASFSSQPSTPQLGRLAQGSTSSGQAGGADGDASSLSQRLTLGFKQLKDSIEQVLGKTLALEQQRDVSPRGNSNPGHSSGAQTASADGTTKQAWLLGEGGSGGSGGQQMVCLIEADRKLFEELCLVSSCATDHIPDAYYQALKQLHMAIMTGRVYSPDRSPGPDAPAGAPAGQVQVHGTGASAPDSSEHPPATPGAASGPQAPGTALPHSGSTVSEASRPAKKGFLDNLLWLA